jgi:transcriptional regulator with XRE-family HTH domain
MPLHIFAKNLRARRLQLNFTQVEMAKKLGLRSSKRYQHWENGICWPETHLLLLQMCDILQIESIDDFVRRDWSRSVKRRQPSAKNLSNKVNL